jgi:3-deoxy-manno-octulosonate cytidylyltransferase (CMP-KDO synthetase)
MLENGMKIKIVTTDLETIGVDTPEDLKRARAYYQWMQEQNKK